MIPNATSEPRPGLITFDGDYATIAFNRVLRNPTDLVWQALTDPAELKQWLMCSSAKIDGRVGGMLAMVAGPAQFQVSGKILAWNPPHVFEHEWKVAPVDPMPKGEDAVFRYELLAQGDETLLTAIYRHLTRRTAIGFAPGTHVLLDRLEAQLNKEPLPGWMARLEEIRSLYPD